MIQQLNPTLFSTSASKHSSKGCDRFPADWPRDGSIDLAIHDLPHASSTTEWWYVNSHFQTDDGQKFSLFASFFRLAIGRHETTRELLYAHSLTWRLCDVDAQKYYTNSLVDRCAPQVGIKMLESSDNKTDPLLKRALREVFDKGNVPRPDRLLEKDAKVNLEKLELDFDGNRFEKLIDGRYKLTLFDKERHTSCELYFQTKTLPVRHGDNGVVRGTSGEDMFYYFMPQCQVEGKLIREDSSSSIVGASGWYDHEFGKPASNEQEVEQDTVLKQDIAWNWISVQLGNGYQISAYDLFDNNNPGMSCGRWAIVIDREGNWQNYTEFAFQPLQHWTSSRTFNTYPIAWQLEIPAANLHVTVEAEFASQEFITIISKPAFWEGRVRITGTMNGQAIEGLGFVERSGFDSVQELSNFLKAVSRETQKSVEVLLPLRPNDEQMDRLVASPTRSHYLDGLDRNQYARTLIQPIREIIDRGGKAWRSYAALACMDIVGGNSQEFMHWLAWPELLHVGSLIVDDVQDRSSIRRGGPSCHQIYGEPLAINAGNASYFLGQILLLNSTLSDTDKLRIYELYFETLRAAHAGQAIDIDGFNHLMPEVVQQGEGELLEKRILAVHRLKSAVPASSLARLGAIIGKGTPTQVEALGYFFEALGLAFQIVDDVLNLRGFKHDLKLKGEDIACGKVTFPVAKAMSRLALAERRSLWEIIASKPTDVAIIATAITQLEQCGAIDACVQQANDLVESAWKRLDPIVLDSDVKVKLRAFSWYVLKRHY